MKTYDRNEQMKLPFMEEIEENERQKNQYEEIFYGFITIGMTAILVGYMAYAILTHQ